LQEHHDWIKRAVTPAPASAYDTFSHADYEVAMQCDQVNQPKANDAIALRIRNGINVESVGMSTTVLLTQLGVCHNRAANCESQWPLEGVWAMSCPSVALPQQFLEP
jgi:hypothetical protein